MQSPELQLQIADLEKQLSHFQTQLDQAFEDNAELAKTKAIYHEMKKISEKLAKFKDPKNLE